MLDLGAQTDPDGKPGMWEHLRVEYSSFLMILMSWDDLSDPYPPKYTQIQLPQISFLRRHCGIR